VEVSGPLADSLRRRSAAAAPPKLAMPRIVPNRCRTSVGFADAHRDQHLELTVRDVDGLMPDVNVVARETG
jgi:hypothetical protein